MANESTSIHYPWSGAVNQAFDIMNSWFRTAAGQIGLVNITVGSSADPELEKRILEGVGTYGRQLGRISDALRVLVDQAEKRGLDVQEKKALTAFTYQADQIDAIKERHQK